MLTSLFVNINGICRHTNIVHASSARETEFVLNITVIQHEHHLSHVQCPRDTQSSYMYAAACHGHLLQ